MGGGGGGVKETIAVGLAGSGVQTNVDLVGLGGVCLSEEQRGARRAS